MSKPPETLPIAPHERTIGQLVADALRFYGDHAFAALALGIGPAALTVAVAALEGRQREAAFVFGWPVLMAISYVAACFLVVRAPYDGRRLATAALVALLLAVPVPLLVTLLVLPAVLWLALVGMAVPAAVCEGTGVRESIRRGFTLGRADFVHAAGTIATLVLLVVVTQLVMYQLLHGLSEQASAVAAFLASMVITPVLFIGSAMLYDDQLGRAAVKSERTRT